MSPEAAAAKCAALVGVSPDFIPELAKEAAQARRHKDWGRDCGWKSDPERAAARITRYLDSFGEED
jgi:hypothetical protein